MVKSEELRQSAELCRKKRASGNTFAGTGQILETLALIADAIADAIADERKKHDPVFKADKK